MKRIFLSFFIFTTLALIILDFTVGPAVNKMTEPLLEDEIQIYYSDLARGTFHLLDETLKNIPESRWEEEIRSLQKQFGYPIDVVLKKDLSISEEEEYAFLSNQVLIREDEDFYLYRRINQTDYLLSLGPFEDVKVNNKYLLIPMIYGVALVFLAIFTTIWALPFWRKLRTISNSAIDFGAGNLQSRAVISKRSSLAPLADSFNNMADRIQQLINTQRELANAVSHELRTPIARIRFGLEMLGSSEKEMDKKHYFSEISQDIDELDNLVSESLTYARFDYSTPQDEKQSCILKDWLEPIVIKAKKAHLNTECDLHNLLSPFDKKGWLEPHFMERAVSNLIQNGINHAKTHVEVTLFEDEKDIIIYVDDDGTGIAKDDRSRIFQPFTRIDESRSKATGGFGLGLAIVQRIITWHGGTVKVSDSPLGGARFTLRWSGLEQKGQ